MMNDRLTSKNNPRTPLEVFEMNAARVMESEESMRAYLIKHGDIDEDGKLIDPLTIEALDANARPEK
jgi:hypothetical protein